MTQYLPTLKDNVLPDMIRFALEEYDKAPRRHRSDLHHWLQALGIYHLPKVCYQQMYSIAQVVGTDSTWRLRETQDKIRKVLMDWLEEHHPDKGLSAIADFSAREARAIHPELGWGMYVYLLPNVQPVKGIWEQMEDMDKPAFSLTELTRQYREYFWGKEEARTKGLPPKPKGLPDPRRTYPREPKDCFPPKKEEGTS